jgi:hypothetical protein
MKTIRNPSRNRRIVVAALLVFAIAAFIIWNNQLRHAGAVPSVQAAAHAVPLDPPLVPRPTAEAVARMSPTLLKALGLVEGMSADQRIDTLRIYPEALTADESQLLLHHLIQGPGAGESAGWYSEYMHEICCLLGRSKADAILFAQVLAAMAADDNREETVRDYSLQHLRLLWETADATLRPRIEASIESLAVTDSPLAPSALLSLHLLGSSANAALSSPDFQPSSSARKFAVPDSRINPALSKILSEPPSHANSVARMTAARIIRERGLRDRIGDLRNIASDASGEQAVVRMAAIATIAELGSPADISFLNTLDRRDSRIDSVLRHSLPSKP